MVHLSECAESANVVLVVLAVRLVGPDDDRHCLLLDSRFLSAAIGERAVA